LTQDLQNDKKPRLLVCYNNPCYANYSLRYRELGCRFSDFFRHDLKNYQNAILMALDLYRLKNDDKYLDKIDEILQKSLEYIGFVKQVETHVFGGGLLGFYSCFSMIDQITKQYPSHSFKVTGEDCFVLADASFQSIFELIFLNAFREGETHETLFSVSKFVENDVPKCRIDMTFQDFSVSKSIVDDILKNDSLSMSGNFLSMCLYVAKSIAYRCEGKLLLKEAKDNQTTFSLILLQENKQIFKSLPKS